MNSTRAFENEHDRLLEKLRQLREAAKPFVALHAMPTAIRISTISIAIAISFLALSPNDSSAAPAGAATSCRRRLAVVGPRARIEALLASAQTTRAAAGSGIS